jgi:uncharacterized protein (DUF885 family)
MPTTQLSVLALVVALVGALVVSLVVSLGLPAQALAATAGPAAQLQQLFADERVAYYRDDPVSASSEGIHDYDDRLPTVTPAAQARRLAADQVLLVRLAAIDRAALSPQEQVSAHLFDFMVRQRVTLAAHRDWRIPLNSDSGFHAELLFLHEVAPPKTLADYEHYLQRLADLPRFFGENVANMRLGLREGFTLPAEILPGLSRVIAAEQYARPEDCPLYTPFAQFPTALSAADQTRLRAAGRAVIASQVLPTYAAFQQFFDQDYVPGARRTLGAAALPGGAAYYADLVRYYTTLPEATPERVHATGLAEVQRIRADMEAIIDEVGFQAPPGQERFKAFLTFLRTDPQFYPKTAGELLREAAFIAKDVDWKLPHYFGHLPRTPYGVRPVPAHLAPNYTAGRYNPGPMGGAGEYWVNTTALDKRPLYALPALTLHESVPGHHLQGSISRELVAVPAFRLNFYPHAFGEGWGLYAEWLGQEMGMYRTPYERFGRLTYEMWRACRLVVDTGLHSQGWTRQQALDYLADNTALSTLEIRTETDRYIGWPGQALAYKMGELKIRELRAQAEQTLGAKFDLRAFHDTVLGNGGVTLAVLEQQVTAWVARVQAGGGS